MLNLNRVQQATLERGGKWCENPGLDFRAMELGGEAGELLESVLLAANVSASAGKALNAAKKLSRHQKGMAGGNPDLTPVAEELGDVVLSAAILANDLGINLGAAVADKFNKTSVKFGFPDRLPTGCMGCGGETEHRCDCPVWLRYHEGMNYADPKVPAIQ